MLLVQVVTDQSSSMFAMTQPARAAYSMEEGGRGTQPSTFDRVEGEVRRSTLQTHSATSSANKFETAEIIKAETKDRLTQILLLLFGIPIMSTLLMSADESVRYWVGYMDYRIALGCWLWIALGQHIMSKTDIRLLMLKLLVVPALVLMFASNYTKHVTWDYAAQLSLQDCATFERKHQLQRAWIDAKDLLDKCIDAEVAVTGSPREEVEMIVTVDRCDDYAQGLKKWGKEWTYLKDLESEQSCAGWCEVGRPLWNNPSIGQVVDGRDRCSLVVAQTLQKNTHRVTDQITIFCSFIVVVLGLAAGRLEY